MGRRRVGAPGLYAAPRAAIGRGSDARCTWLVHVARAGVCGGAACVTLCARRACTVFVWVRCSNVSLTGRHASLHSLDVTVHDDTRVSHGNLE